MGCGGVTLVDVIRTVSTLAILVCAAAAGLMLPASAPARDSDADSDLSRLERRRQELFIPDEVLDPSFPDLVVEEPVGLQGDGNSDSVVEEPLDPDSEEDAVEQQVIAGERVDETDQAMNRDHFDESTTPFKPAPEALGEEFKDPVEW